MQYKCQACNAVFDEMKVKCPACRAIARITLVKEVGLTPSSTAPVIEHQKPVQMTSQALRPPSPRFTFAPSSPPTSTLPGSAISSSASSSSSSFGITGPTFAPTPTSITLDDKDNSASPPSKLNAGRGLASKVIEKFGATGLWFRSIQITKADYLTKYSKSFDTSNKDVAGAWADCWSFAHHDIVQSYFQVAPKDGTEGKRAAALIVDWTMTSNHYVDFSLKDASSNKRFQGGATTKPSECEAAMKTMLQELRGKKIDNCEVRSCEFNNVALVGLVWGPIKHPTGISEADGDWPSSKHVFTDFLQTLQHAGIATGGLPVFVYQNSESVQTLEYIDFVG
jgi:hypothetical protein